MEENLKLTSGMDHADVNPPYAPLAMPRQGLERDRRDGVIVTLLRLLFARNA